MQLVDFNSKTKVSTEAEHAALETFEKYIVPYKQNIIALAKEVEVLQAKVAELTKKEEPIVTIAEPEKEQTNSFTFSD